MSYVSFLFYLTSSLDRHSSHSWVVLGIPSPYSAVNWVFRECLEAFKPFEIQLKLFQNTFSPKAPASSHAMPYNCSHRQRIGKRSSFSLCLPDRRQREVSAFIRTLAVCVEKPPREFVGARLLKRTKDTLLFCPLGGYLEKAGKSSLKICCWNFSKRGKERACERQQNGPRLPHLVHVRGRNRPTVLRLWAQHAETELEQPQTGKEDGVLPDPRNYH